MTACSIEIAINRKPVPQALLTALQEKNRGLTYTAARFLYHYVWAPYSNTVRCGVFGDGPNASYEWFIWDENNPRYIRTSNCGYGCDVVALRDVLQEVEKDG
jgi:hypothetical protein